MRICVCVCSFGRIYFYLIIAKKLNIYFITGSAFGTRQNRRFTYAGEVNLHAGTNRIALLSVAVGLPVSFLIHLY